ncbi:MAG: hypothetical protein H6824_05630 [Planctomycetaceae bacterium]|nr:hypothetical protein [Planctomycetaceae bacterium]
MNNWTEWFRHAFAVDATEGELTPQQQAVVHAVAREVVRRQLTVPSVALLEMSRPLNYIGAQALHVFGPALSVLMTSDDHETFANFLERRDSLEILTAVIEDLEKQATLQEQKQAEGPK